MTNPWLASGEWLKGALHVHTTNSDGKLSPQEVVDTYRQAGYDFVVLTDHGRVTPPDTVDGQGMVVLGGAEVGIGRTQHGGTYHLVAVGLKDQLPEGLSQATLGEAVALLRAQGALVYLAHPYWSLLTLEDLLAADFDGLEVFNAGCEYETRHGDAVQHVDWMMARDRMPRLIAVDDSHFGFWDACGGWTMVKAADRTPEAILEALRAGFSYASAGPIFEDLELCEDGLVVRSSPVRAVTMIRPGAGQGWTTDSTYTTRPRDTTTTEAVAPVPMGTPFRIEVIDAQGRKAWMNPMVLRGEQ
ncbi:MAG: CehA/McbA family metallohydrolase [Armatimonadetes bacterium]|nr:CehA/McbA family metallohydrolase [Armatimonadota bacterium]